MDNEAGKQPYGVPQWALALYKVCSQQHTSCTSIYRHSLGSREEKLHVWNSVQRRPQSQAGWFWKSTVCEHHRSFTKETEKSCNLDSNQNTDTITVVLPHPPWLTSGSFFCSQHYSQPTQSIVTQNKGLWVVQCSCNVVFVDPPTDIDVTPHNF